MVVVENISTNKFFFGKKIWSGILLSFYTLNVSVDDLSKTTPAFDKDQECQGNLKFIFESNTSEIGFDFISGH